MGGWLVVLVGSLMYIRVDTVNPLVNPLVVVGSLMYTGVDTVNPLEGGMAQRLLSQRDELVQVEVNFFI